MLGYQLLALAYTESCPFSCDHCIGESSPNRIGKMSIADAKRYVRSAHEMKIPGVGITGGEPFLYFHEILELIEFATGLGMKTSVITSGYWAFDPVRAGEMMGQLVEKGLDVLAVSCDEFHQRHVPLSQLRALADLCSRIGLRMTLNVCRSAKNTCEYGDIKATVHEQSLLPLGRASNLSDDFFVRYETPPRGSCNNLLLPRIDWNGQIFACCGPARFSTRTSPLCLGNVNELGLRETLLRAAEEPILGAVNVWGPYGLWKLLQDGGPNQLYRPRQRYLGGICMLCLDLLNSPNLVTALHEKLERPEIKRRLEAALLVANYRIKIENASKRATGWNGSHSERSSPSYCRERT